MSHTENNDSVFDRFPGFIQDYIYAHSWESLREVQIAAAQEILDTENHLLLTSTTASGKTEAAFFPILTRILETHPQSVSVLYIAPLKSLINDQYERMKDILEESGIPVTHWHGDVGISQKKKLLTDPRGILQITPESLESMLINRSNDIPRLFGDLEFIVLDEIHTMVGTDRGNQVMCQISRISHSIGKDPRRIGLSATVGDPSLMAQWLGQGSLRNVSFPDFGKGQIHWRLGMEHFYYQKMQEEKKESGQSVIDAGYEYMYDCVQDKKSIVFSNSREETEYITATLRQIAKNRHEKDIFRIHHGNLSASIREETEAVMKDDDIQAVACATVTMELGIDIGKLERIIQNQAPNSVSSFLQRLGRSGRRNNPPEMMMVFREEDALPNTPLPQLIPWELLQGIAIVQLYLEERFIEEPRIRHFPMSLCFHQTLSILASSGELAPSRLADILLALPPFSNVSRDDYRLLLHAMIQNDFIEMTEEGGLIVGLAGEKLIGSFKFYAVFKDSEDFTVRCESDEIGTITSPPPVGDRFALAGRIWEVEEIDATRRLVYVKGVEGKMEISWPGDYGEIHTKILERMKQILCEDEIYPYLKENAVKRLIEVRHLARKTGLPDSSLIHLGGYSYCFFPWLGTRSFRTFRKYLQYMAKPYGISNIEYEGCYYISFRMEKATGEELIRGLAERVRKEGIRKENLVSVKETPLFDKYDVYVPGDLLRKEYVMDRLRTDEVIQRIESMEQTEQSRP